MNPLNALAALARRCGIATNWLDRRGQRHVVTPETLRSMLTAMRLPVGVEPPGLIASLDAEEATRLMPAVQVVRRGAPIRVELSIPAEMAGRTHRWKIYLENGASQIGEFVPAELNPARAASNGSDGFQRMLLEVPAVGDLGYHRLELERPAGTEPDSMALIVTPLACYQPEAIQQDRRAWGPGTDVFAVRSRHNWGGGDFTDICSLVDLTAEAGGGIVGLHSLHAWSCADTVHADPYLPSSRAFLNTLCLDVEALPEFRSCGAARELVSAPGFQARLRSLRAEEWVNETVLSTAKAEVLELLYRHFRERDLSRSSGRAVDFQRFVESGGDALRAYARFEALRIHFGRPGQADVDWRTWPDPYRDPGSPAVAEFATDRSNDVEFALWLQWAAANQLAEAGVRSRRRGLGIGLCLDLAESVDPAGADVWRWQSVFANGARIGVPPGCAGRSTGGVPFIPDTLRRAAYRPYIEAVTANMKYAGALRILGANGLKRAFWIPEGGSPDDGTYVDFPFEDLLGIIALESHRNRCLVIAEHCESSPVAFHEEVATVGMLSQRSFFFERTEAGAFRPPAEYPGASMVAVSSPGHPGLHGFWRGCDLDTRATAGRFRTEAEREAMVVERACDCARLLLALEKERLLPEGASTHPVAVPELTSEFVTAVHAYLARTPARVLIVQPEDILGMPELSDPSGCGGDPGSSWRRRLTLDLEDWRYDERLWRVGEMLRSERGVSVTPEVSGTAELPAAIIPRATYRLQFNRGFTFADATELVPYLAELGVSHCYASPYLKARPGSMHGYDIVDHGALNSEIGTREDYDRWIDALERHGMGHILDVVPNHMGVMGADNAWWLDVLENGPASLYGRFFDIDWESLNPGLQGKVLLPLLGEHYGVVLNRGELRLTFDPERGEFSLFYYQHRLPIDPATYPRIISRRQEHLAEVMGKDHPQLFELQALSTAFGHLPPRLTADPAQQAERQRDKEVHKRRLATLYASNSDVAHHVAENLRELNGRPGDAPSFDTLHELIQAQSYRLAFWRVASDEINYRRFFDINDLAALRMEESAVFEATHRFVLDLVAAGKIQGLRIDHPDGLYDPGQYFRRIQEAVRGGVSEPGSPLAVYLVIEKILADHERLLDDWMIHGATGYRFANLTNALFVNADAEAALTRIYGDFIGESEDFDTLVYRAKKLIVDTSLASGLNVLANRLARIAAASRNTCDFTLNNLRDALAEIVACFPVYRSYVSAAGLSSDDRRHIDWAVAVAKKRSPAADVSIFDFVHDVLTGDIAQYAADSYREAVLEVAMTFQQFSAPVMAKGVEDTAFYRYHRLVSLNDVGGEPRRFGISVTAYHAATRNRALRWPHNQLATSTHDSKRSEDVRARINVLSEMAEGWGQMVERWSRMNRGRKRESDGQPIPASNDEYLLYQTLVGTWPPGDPAEVDLDAYRGRIQAYMIKAVREAKEHTSWININAEYEDALVTFIAALLSPGETNLFLADFIAAVGPIIRFGMINSLAQTALKLTAPGVPDIYQGCELWQFTLVDPDNRSPVDFDLRRRFLQQLKPLSAATADERREMLKPLIENIADGRIKLYLLRQALRLRAAWPEVFRDGDYLPLSVSGDRDRHVCSFARRAGDRAVLVAVPRLTAVLVADAQTLPVGGGIWQDTAVHLPSALARNRWRDVLSGDEYGPSQSITAGRLFHCLPVALLETVPP